MTFLHNIRNFLCCCCTKKCDKTLTEKLICENDINTINNINGGFALNDVTKTNVKIASIDSNIDDSLRPITGRVIKVLNYNTFMITIKNYDNDARTLFFIRKQLGWNHGITNEQKNIFNVKMNGFRCKAFDEIYDEYKHPEKNVYSLAELARDSLISKMLGEAVVLKNITLDKGSYILADVYLNDVLIHGWIIEHGLD